MVYITGDTHGDLSLFKNPKLKKLNDDDILIITADHGCDPGDNSTDHTREYIPLVVYGKKIKPENLGIRKTYADISASIAEYFGIDYSGAGESFFSNVKK